MYGFAIEIGSVSETLEKYVAYSSRTLEDCPRKELGDDCDETTGDFHSPFSIFSISFSDI
jgi:hypothetical protein